MSNLVPEGWSYDQLGDYISESVAGEWGVEATGDTNDIPVLRSTNFTASGIIDYSKLAYRNIDERKRLAKSLKFGDIVLEKSGGSPTQPVGRVVYFDKYKPFLFSNFTQKLSPVDTCDSKFLFYKLYSEYQNGTVLKFQQQTTGIINFQLAEYLGYKSAFPPLPEQQKIATILSSVDEVIEKTRAQIDKLKDLKTGMMQELLTKGIGHTEFKDSPLGQVPEGWQLLSMRDICSVRQGLQISISERHSKPSNNRWVYLTIRYINTGFDKSVAEYIENPKSSVVCTEDDIILARTGATGKVVTGISGVFHNNFFMVDYDRAKTVKNFLVQYLNSPFVQHEISNRAGTTTIPDLNHGDFYTIPMILPPVAEQLKLAEVLESLDILISNKISKYAAMEKAKKALMQDLLTGKVRVNLTDKESAVV